MRIWTDEQINAQSETMKSLWVKPDGTRYSGLKMRRRPDCPDCGESDISKFYVDPKGRRTNARCKECHKRNCKIRWHSKTTAEKQASRMHSMYGITPEEYIAMHDLQQGKCAICKEQPTTQRGLHVDHCHKTNKVRGLLCHGCNTGLGSFRENPHYFRNAIEYLGVK
jgi:hypothetical protein